MLFLREISYENLSDGNVLIAEERLPDTTE